MERDKFYLKRRSSDTQRRKPNVEDQIGSRKEIERENVQGVQPGRLVRLLLSRTFDAVSGVWFAAGERMAELGGL